MVGLAQTRCTLWDHTRQHDARPVQGPASPAEVTKNPKPQISGARSGASGTATARGAPGGPRGARGGGREPPFGSGGGSGASESCNGGRRGAEGRHPPGLPHKPRGNPTTLWATPKRPGATLNPPVQPHRAPSPLTGSPIPHPQPSGAGGGGERGQPLLAAAAPPQPLRLSHRPAPEGPASIPSTRGSAPSRGPRVGPGQKPGGWGPGAGAGAAPPPPHAATQRARAAARPRAQQRRRPPAPPPPPFWGRPDPPPHPNSLRGGCEGDTHTYGDPLKGKKGGPQRDGEVEVCGGGCWDNGEWGGLLPRGV